MQTVLLVDDAATMRLMTGRILEAQGYLVTTCKSGPEALDALKRITPDVFLIDVFMPDMDGFSLARTLRSDPRWLDTPMLFLSASEDPDDRLRGFRLGADDFIPKTSGPEEICLRLKRVMETHQRNKERIAPKTVRHNSSMTGDLAMIGPAALLMMCYTERKTGELILCRDQHHVQLWISCGNIINAQLRGQDIDPKEVVYEILSWSDGDFTLTQQAVNKDIAITTSLTGLLMEGARLLDESPR